MSQNIIELSKGTMEYRFEGAGPAIMVLNGGHCSRKTRISHELLVDAGYSVLTPSRPGYDKSSVALGATVEETAVSMIELLDELGMDKIDLIGVSAAGMTALAIVQLFPERINKVIFESAKTTDWEESTKKKARILFGGIEKMTWVLMRFFLKIFPKSIIKALLMELTTKNVNEVVKNLSVEELEFFKKEFKSFQSGKGFITDIEHKLKNTKTFTNKTLIMYSCNDKIATISDLDKIKQLSVNNQVYEVDSDSHFIWIGKTKKAVWEQRLEFLKS